MSKGKNKQGMFSMVQRSVWRSERFMSLEEDRDRLLFFYFMTCPHQTNVGCYRLPDGYACADLGFTLDEYRASRGRLVDSGLIDHDPDTEEIYVDRWLHKCPPTNRNHAAGVEKFIYGIESDRLREKVEQAFTDVWQPNGEGQPSGGGPPSRHDLTQTGYMNGQSGKGYR